MQHITDNYSLALKIPTEYSNMYLCTPATWCLFCTDYWLVLSPQKLNPGRNPDFTCLLAYLLSISCVLIPLLGYSAISPTPISPTFHGMPQTFYQIFTIHASKKAIPFLAYCLPSKTRVVYLQTLEFVKQKAKEFRFDMTPAEVLTDFELATIQDVQPHLTRTISQ